MVNHDSWDHVWMRAEQLKPGMWIDLAGDFYIEAEDKEIWEEEYAEINSIDPGEAPDSVWLTFGQTELNAGSHDVLMPTCHEVKVVRMSGSQYLPPVILELV